MDELLYAIGIGNQMPMVIAKRLISVQEDGVLEKTISSTPLAIKGTEGMVVHFAECCQPIPGDSIVGRFQQGRGILVHTSECEMIKHRNNSPEQFVSMRWDEKVQGDFWVDITVEVEKSTRCVGCDGNSDF